MEELNKNLATIAALLEVQARISVARLNAQINPGSLGLKQFTFEEFLAELPREETKETIDNEQETN